MYRRQLVEHTGTHLVAPNYLSTDGQTADEIPIEMLVVPLAICNISAKAADDPDAQVTPDDIAAWITANGAIPDGACVANLGDLPAVGATLVVGAPKIKGATGGPSRVMALV
jgi:kynurenine formamidase